MDLVTGVMFFLFFFPFSFGTSGALESIRNRIKPFAPLTEATDLRRALAAGDLSETR
jgi:hypothetical protein